MDNIDKKFLGASKKIKPDKAIGNLFKAPTMEQVVDEVTRTHQPEQYEIPTEAIPEIIIAVNESLDKLVAKLAEDQSSKQKEATNKIGKPRILL